MKKFYFVLFFLAILAFSCSKDGLMDNNQGIDQLNNASLKCTGSVIKVYPGPNDTQSLIDAFATATAIGKNAVVKLMPGTFKIGWIEVKEFNGTFSGSGKGKTIVTNFPDLTPDAVIAQNKVPALITFIGGDVSVSDLSVKMPEALSWLGTQEMNMLLFSDYSADFTPSKKHIGVNLNNIEVIGVLQKNVDMGDGTVIDFPYGAYHGVKFAPDILDQYTALLRCNIDININKSEFSKFSTGVYVWGCKKGNFRFGIEGGNIFTENNQGLCVNENIGVNVKIMNNEFTTPTHYWDGVDLNAGEAAWEGYTSIENVPGVLGNYEIRNNIFNNINYSIGMGIMDAWRYGHPEDPRWINIIVSKNTFNTTGELADPWVTYNVKNALFSDNIIKAEALITYLYMTGFYWLTPDDPNYMLSWTEGCKFLNNKIMSENTHIYFDWCTKDNLVVGDLSNVTVEDYGVNNQFKDITHSGHATHKSSYDQMNRIERMRDMYGRHFNHKQN
jgi:hypothetical protein